jgi:PGF-CTERM protein
MHSKRMLVLAVVLMICAVPVMVSAATANDVSNGALAQQGTTTTTDTMGNGTMNDSMGDTMTTTTNSMSDDQMTTTDSMDDGTTDDQMTDETMTDDNMNDGESGNSDTSLPGFGVGVALVALAGGALYIARNR